MQSRTGRLAGALMTLAALGATPAFAQGGGGGGGGGEQPPPPPQSASGMTQAQAEQILESMSREERQTRTDQQRRTQSSASSVKDW